MKTNATIPMPDGEARAFVFTPDAGPGPWPVILFYMDGPAIRPALFQMGERMAQAGYYVLLPDMFWRLGPYPPIDIATAFGSPEGRKMFRETYFSSTDPLRAMADTGVFLAWLDAQPHARPGPFGVTGYCMGGGFALRAAAAFPDRFAAAASFHPSNLATDEPDSPHLAVARIKARVLVAGGDQDASFDEAQKDRLAAALSDGGVDAEVSIWAGCRHGWVPTDMPIHNAEGAERHWRELIALFDGTLK
ncbi:MAG: dienelactone hydrolase family protein [Alphaproteobacteria bacterium]